MKHSKEIPNFTKFLEVIINATSENKLRWKPYYRDITSDSPIGPDIVRFYTMYKGKKMYLSEYSNIQGTPSYVVDLDIMLDFEQIFKTKYPEYQEKLINLFLYAEKQNPTDIEDFINSFIQDFS